MCSCENEHNPQWRCGERFTVQGRNSSVMLAHITAAKNCWKKRANISRVSVCKCDDYIASVAYSWETERERLAGKNQLKLKANFAVIIHHIAMRYMCAEHCERFFPSLCQSKGVECVRKHEMNASANKNVFTWNIKSRKIFSSTLFSCTLSSLFSLLLHVVW